MSESGRKRPGSDGASENTGKRPCTPSLYDWDFDFPADIPVAEETVNQVVMILENEINGVEDASSSTSNMASPSTSPLPISSVSSSSSSSSVNMKGKEESCGPSVSDSASTVMASFDTCGIDMPDFTVPSIVSPPDASVNWQWVLEDGQDYLWPILDNEVQVPVTGNKNAPPEMQDEWLAGILSLDFDE